MPKDGPFQAIPSESARQPHLPVLRSPKPAHAPARPHHWTKPPYRSADYWAAVSNGWISWEEAEADNALYEERRARALDVQRTGKRIWNARHGRPEPRPSRQYAGHMVTTAARDDRLTPQSKALLQVIRARCGNGRQTETCKTTLADIMSRHPRSVQRYLSELAQFGYIRTRIRRGFDGLYTGLVIWITETVLPFFANDGALAEWLQNPAFSDRTQLSPTNYPSKNPLYGDERNRASPDTFFR